MSLPHLTVAYLTSRREPMVEWFFDSLGKEMRDTDDLVGVLVVAVHTEAVRRQTSLRCVTPKPTVWQGPHRLTKVDYFAAANARNTALCLAPDGWIAMVDDLSVLMPGWLAAVRRAMMGNYLVYGSYKKVKRLVVEDGVAVSWEETPGGIDSRWPRGSSDDAIPIAGAGGTYGCSFAAPVEALLSINGFDERCDCVGLGSEDDMAGLMLQKQGYDLRYDRRMLTLESEERHHWEPPMKRVIETGHADKDASWALLNSVKGGDGRSHNEHLGPGGIRALRLKVLAGEPFPLPTGPLLNWYTGVPVSSL